MFLFWNFTLKCKALLNQLTHQKNYLMHIIEYLTCSIIATRNNYQKKFNSISYFCLKFELTSLSLHDTFAWKVSLTYFYFKIWGTPITNTWDICVKEQFWYFFFEIWSALNHFMLKKCCFDSFAWNLEFLLCLPHEIIALKESFWYFYLKNGSGAKTSNWSTWLVDSSVKLGWSINACSNPPLYLVKLRTKI